MRLQTERLIISHPRKKDAFDVYAHRTDIRANIFTGGVPSLSWPDFEASYQARCDRKDAKKEHLYSVILKQSDKYIGYCGFQYCDTLGGVELLYGYSSHYWGNGYALEAAEAMLSYGFENLGYESIEAAVNPKNPGSERILVKIGMTFISEIEWPEQGLVHKYAITKEEFDRRTVPGGSL